MMSNTEREKVWKIIVDAKGLLKQKSWQDVKELTSSISFKVGNM